MVAGKVDDRYSRFSDEEKTEGQATSESFERCKVPSVAEKRVPTHPAREEAADDRLS